jgi:hypothetical protein
MIAEMRRRLRHPPRHAGRTDTASLAREGDAKIRSACIAGGARTTAGEDAAFEEAANFPFDVRRNGLTVPIRLPRQLQIGCQPFLQGGSGVADPGPSTIAGTATPTACPVVPSGRAYKALR